jgi:hypothetical protein
MHALLLLLVATVLPPAPARLPVRVLPFELHEGSVWLSVRVNGSPPLRFELDTGSSLDVVDRARAEELGLSIKERGLEWNVGVGDGLTRRASARQVALEIAGLPVVAERVEILDLQPMARGKGRQMDGMLGATLLDQFVVAIDYAARTVTLYDPTRYVYDGSGEVLTLRPVAGTLRLWAVRAEIAVGFAEPVEGDFIVDSPVALAAVLTTGFVRDHELLWAAHRAPAGLQTGEMLGLGGVSRAWVGRVAELRLGSLVVPAPMVAFANTDRGVLAGRRIAGVLGGGTLSRFRVILDCARHRMILEPAAERNAGETGP